ncbi:MAG TPA: hypothetical protein VIL31_10295 [Cyclobacteriaceae bacterium]|jgi:hypothetical protein
MIERTQFWKSWKAEHRYAWYGMAAAFALAVVFYMFSYFRGVDAILHWEKIQEQKVLESTLDTYRLGPFELSVPGDNYVILEYFNGSMIDPNMVAVNLYLIMLAIGVVVLLAVITTFDRFWFIAAMALLILIWYSLRLRVLEVFGQLNEIPLVVTLVVFGGIAIYFNMIRPGIDVARRAIVFAAAMAMFTLVVALGSRVDYPFMHLAVTAYPAAVVITILFILLVSHEILAALISILSRSGASRIQHFFILTTIYLANLLVTALHELDIINWNFVYLNAYLLLAVSAVLGIWGFRDRQSTYENILSFSPAGAMLYLATATIAFGTIGGLLGNANDAALNVMEDIIVFSHLGFSFIFVLYVLSNFASLLGSNLPMHKVLYKPTRMPWFTFQFMGLIATLGFVFYVGWRVYVYDAVSGFYTYLGDLDLKLNNIELARAHFDRARSYGFQSHHANYAMAKLTQNRYNLEEPERHLDLANGKRPSTFSLVNSGNLKIWQTRYFDAIKNLRRSQSRVPGSGVLENNLGYAYAKVFNIDSALYLFSEARDATEAKPTAEANILGLSALEFLPMGADSTLALFDDTYTGTLANALAIANAQGQSFSRELNPFASSKLNLHSATLLNNYLLKNIGKLDSATLARAYALADDSVNSDFMEALKVPVAIGYYYQHNVTRALDIMAELVYISSTYEGNYNYTMGLWALEQGNPARAASFFNYAVSQNYKRARLYKAIALTEDRNVTEALAAWDSVLAHGSDAEIEIAKQITQILRMPAPQASSLTDPLKYQFCRYRIGVGDTVLFDSILPTFTDNNYKANALLDMSRRQFERTNLHKAIRYFNQLEGLQLTDENLFNDIRHFELLLLAERRETDKIVRAINEGIEFPPDRYLEKTLYQALVAEANGDSVLAEKNYQIVGTYNPFFEEGVIAAARHYREHSSDHLKAYNTLAEAVQLNNTSVKLWSAYIEEALRVGFDEYAASAYEKVEELRRRP